VAPTAASSLWSTVRYPQRVRALVLRDTAADAATLTLAYDNARRQTRVELPRADFDRYWTGRITDDEDLKARWAEMILLYDYEYDVERSAAAVEAGSYRHEAHNWCFQHNMPGYDLKAQLPHVAAPALVTVGRAEWVAPGSAAQTIVDLLPDAQLVVFERSGHSPQIEEYDPFQQLMRDFLAEAVPEAGAVRS